MIENRVGQFGLLGFLNIGHSIFLAINFSVDFRENCATIATTKGKNSEEKHLISIRKTDCIILHIVL